MYWRIAATAVALGTYLAVLVAMRIDPQDRRLFGLDRAR
jgi:hypothetical protein